MKLVKLLSLAILIIAAGCGPRKPVLHIYTWADYVDPDLVAAFEAANSCRVSIDTFDSNEAMYAKLKAGGAEYDLVLPSSYQIALLRSQQMIQPFDQSLLPNVNQNVDSDYIRFASDPTLEYAIPYAMTFTGIAYRTDKLDPIDASWSVFTNSALRGKCTLLADMRETIGAALKANGYDINSTDPAEIETAAATVIEWKRNIAKFENEQYKTGLASGEFILTHGYNCDVLQVQEDCPDIDFVLPQEGFSFTFDEFVIPVAAPNPLLAHAFIDFMYQANSAAANIAYICSLMPVKTAYPLLDEELRNSPVIFISPAELDTHGQVIQEVGEALPLYTRAWDKIKATK
ncbi:MAG: spermidine/putrescine ABC transporter substrate-binding protein [Lentisphaerae bacterium]|jgi:spermidine/putrescine transport system substrate-binding protein|nr:spermidine/putrescine ABC transporter substrate-binding protein [Lentisphaerota bacterium]